MSRNFGRRRNAVPSCNEFESKNFEWMIEFVKYGSKGGGIKLTWKNERLKKLEERIKKQVQRKTREI
jgi:hypothetical protein